MEFPDDNAGPAIAHDGPTGTALAEWRGNWPVVAGSALAVAFGFASFAFVSSLFVQPLEASFGWSRGAQALVQYAYIVVALTAPLFGAWVDRFGVRRIALTCIPAVALCYLALALMSGSIALYYLFMGCLVLAGQGTAGIVFTRAVAAVFDRSRGLALAASRIGLSIAAAGLPSIVFAAIDRGGWRWGYATLALLALFVSLPATWFWVREPPRRAGVPRPRGGAILSLVRQRKVVILSCAAALMMGPIVGILSQLQPILTGKDIAPAGAARLLGLLALSVVTGTIVTGALADRVWAPVLGFVFSLAGAGGCLILALHGQLSAGGAMLAVLLLGIAQGAEIDLVGYLIAKYFGIADFAKIFGLGIMLIGVTSALASLLFGVTYDRLGSYDAALGGAAFLMTAAALLFLALGAYPRPNGDAIRPAGMVSR